MKPTVGVIGLGIMGSAMAGALIDAGFSVVGTDLRAASRQRLRRAGGRPLASSAAVAAEVDVLIASLPTGAALEAVVAEIAASRKSRPGSRLGSKPGSQRRAVMIETSTLPIADKERARLSLARAGVALIDCPISGTVRRLKEGNWTMFVSGDPKACRKAAPILAVLTRNTPYVGAFGNGSRMKFVANHLVAIYNVSVGESMTFARRMGLDAQQVWDLFAPSPIIGTGVYRLRGKFMVDRKYLPATMKVEVWQKDMQVIGDMARAVDCPVPLFSACLPIYNAAMAQGLAQHDTASVCEVLDRMAGGRRAPKKRPKKRR
jgi:3-hydroxyisobutyrate dehydrogenase-like beta-hydroxyacid dehydrogenase